MPESYLSWVTGYVLVAVGIYVYVCYRHICDGAPMGRDSHLDDLVANIIIVVIMPAAVALLVLAGLAKMAWDVLTAWRGLFRKDSGTEELLMGVWWLYMAWIFASIDGGWWIAALCGLTTVYLWQSAKAMQQLKANKAGESNETPPPHVMARHQELVQQARCESAEEARAYRERLHREHLDWVRLHGALIRDDIAKRAERPTWYRNPEFFLAA